MEYHQSNEGFHGTIFTMHFPSVYSPIPNFFETVEAFVQVETSSDLTQGMTVRIYARKDHAQNRTYASALG